MKLKFSIDYRTVWGQRLFVCGSLDELGQWNEQDAVPMIPGAGEQWELEVEVSAAKAKLVEYKYYLLDERYDAVQWEFGDNRRAKLDTKRFSDVHLRDFWRPVDDPLNNLYTAPFKNAFFNRQVVKPKALKYSSKTSYVRFQIRAPRVGSEYKICVVGDHPALGNWEESKALILEPNDFPVWTGEVAIDASERPLEYKYGIYDSKEKRILTWEARDNRYLPIQGTGENKKLTVWTDEYFVYPVGNWKAAGVSIPVFSIRSDQGTGVGEFTDLKLLVDWAKKTGMRLVQVLPVNDTVAMHSWTDSYPYAAISVYALHPIYGNLNAIGRLKDKSKQQEVDEAAQRLNAQDHVVYEEVMDIKSKYYKWAFDEQKDKLLKSKDFQAFYADNKHWLEPYAVFSYLRDKHGTPDFTQWEGHAAYDAKKIAKLVSPKSKEFDHVAIHFFIQYHLDTQLSEATNYGREQGVVLKGDIPIGIYRNSVDAWMYPQLFNMECQAGAPPDDFSVSGQNWGFPTYNWEEMSKDGFQWWKARLQKMADFFDVFRIDHILGFFRIWEIPDHGVEGTMGHFNPSVPFSTQEIYNWGVNFDLDRMCKPYIREHMLPIIFSEHADQVKQEFLEDYFPGQYRLKQEFDTQRKVKDYFARLIKSNPDNTGYYEYLRAGLYQLIGEVLFFEAPFTNGEGWNPRVGMQNTFSFRELDDNTRNNINKLYIHYFYKRHNEFWRERAMEKLPALKSATDMLICGEDLGMVPDSVPGVMNELSILSLAIQRMPNDSSMEFWHPGDTPFMSVCSTSSHDTSTLRGWWEEDRAKTQRYFNNILGNWGDAPAFCEPWVATQVINQHLYSPSMWAIFPLQDLLAMDGQLRRQNPDEERINVPANPHHYWKYRMHLTLEQLLKEDGFNGFLRQLNDRSGRNADY